LNAEPEKFRILDLQIVSGKIDRLSIKYPAEDMQKLAG
jgi:hypothetical protein